MKITEDYLHWYEGKHDFINELVESESLLFQRIEPVFNTLEHFKTKELSEQEFHIFNVGYMYFAEQIHGIENFIDIIGSLEALESNSVAYNYLMDMNDFYDDHDLNLDKELYSELINQLEDGLKKSEPLKEEVYINLEKLVEEYKDSSSILEIFEQISENLGL